MSDLNVWLGDLGLEQYQQTFADNGVDLRALPYLIDQDLQDLGVLLGHRRILLAAISGLAPTPLAPPPASPPDEAERRPLTVMFCDLVGSTALSTSMDVEDYRELIRAYQDTCAEVVERFDGYMAKFMGDGLLIYFGYPIAHGDDAARAVHAALEIAVTIPTLPDVPEPMAVRIGIATGEVVVGDVLGAGESAERTVLGATPNLAARLQGVADSNQIVVADATHRRLRNEFATTDLGDLALRGIADPVRAWRVDSVQSAPAPDITHMPPFVGREDALTGLDTIWQQVTAGALRIVQISGQPGIGKSRLVHEFIDRLASAGTRPHVATWTCSAFHSNTPLHPIDPDFIPPEATTSDTADAAAQRHATFAAIGNTLVSRATTAPLILIIEDAHWVDPTTIDLIAALPAHLTDLPVLIIIANRTGAAADHLAEVLNQAHPVERLNLDGLSDAHSMALVESIATDALPDFVRRNIVERAGGLPLFVEELTRVVADGRLTDVPETLQDSLLARLDALGPAKRIVQLASVFGRTFDRDDLARLAESDPNTIGPALDQMLDSGLVAVHGQRYIFRHALCREVAYDTLLRGTRRNVHGEIADRMIATGADNPEVIAHHLTAADRHAEAAPYWRQAGSHAAAAWANAEAANHYHAALEHAAALTGTNWELSVRLDLVDSLRILDRYEEALDQLDRAETIANLIGRDEDWLHIHLMRGNIYFPLGDAERCIASQQAARDVAQRMADPTAEARALSGMADARFNNHQIISAEHDFDACVELAEANDLRAIMPANLAMRGHMRLYQCRLNEALDDSERAVTLAVDLGDRRAEIAARGSCFGKALLESGAFEAADNAFTGAGAVAADLGAPRYQALNLAFRGKVALLSGNPAAARDFAVQAATIARASAPQFCLPIILGVIARTADTPDDCRAALAEAEDLLAGATMAHNPLWFFRDAALAAAAHGWSGEVRRYAQALRDTFAKQPPPWCDLVAGGADALATWLETADATAVHTAAGRAHAAGFTAWADTLERAITD